jgi:hypothetical protein
MTKSLVFALCAKATLLIGNIKMVCDLIVLNLYTKFNSLTENYLTLAYLPLLSIYLLLPFQIKRRFDFSKYITFIIYLDIVYIYVHGKHMYLENVKRLNGGW